MFFFHIDTLPDGELQISKGLFVGICLIILIFGIFVGGVFGVLVCRIYRRKSKTSKYNLLKSPP